MKAFQFGDTGNTKERKLSGSSTSENGLRKALHRRERDSLEGPHVAAETQCKALP